LLHISLLTGPSSSSAQLDKTIIEFFHRFLHVTGRSKLVNV